MKPYEVIAATRRTELSPVQRLLLIHVAFRAGGDGECWASAATLASDVGCDERTIRRALGSLVDLGWLSCTKRLGQSAVYRIARTPDTGSGDPGHSVTPDTVSPRTQDPGTPDIGSDPPRTQDPGTPDTMSDDPILDPIQDSIPDPIGAAGGGPTLRVVGRVEPDPDDVEEGAVAALLELQQVSGHLAQKPDENAVRKLLKSHDPDVLRAMWRAAADDDWWRESNEDGAPRLRWRSLARAGSGLDKRIAAAVAAVREQQRPRRSLRPEPIPDRECRPPPPRAK